MNDENFHELDDIIEDEYNNDVDNDEELSFNKQRYGTESKRTNTRRRLDDLLDEKLLRNIDDYDLEDYQDQEDDDMFTDEHEWHREEE